MIRGGRYSQGTFVSYDLAIDYTNILSEEIHQWFTSSLQRIEEVDNSKTLALSEFQEFDGNVRITPDGRVSVYDAIEYVTGYKNRYQVWNDLTERFPVFLQKTEEYKFEGRGGKARLTPVATLQVFLEILMTLPGRIAAQVREKAIRTLIRVMKGDPTFWAMQMVGLAT